MDHLGFKIVGSLHILVANEKDPSPSDWKDYANALHAEVKKGVDVTQFRTLVFSDGGGPNATQRKVISDLLEGKPSPLAIVSGSTVVRGVTTALTWFNPKVRAFSPTDVGLALEFLQVPLLKFDSIKQAGLELQTKLRVQHVVALEQARLTGASLPTSART